MCFGMVAGADSDVGDGPAAAVTATAANLLSEDDILEALIHFDWFYYKSRVIDKSTRK